MSSDEDEDLPASLVEAGGGAKRPRDDSPKQSLKKPRAQQQEAENSLGGASSAVYFSSFGRFCNHIFTKIRCAAGDSG